MRKSASNASWKAEPAASPFSATTSGLVSERDAVVEALPFMHPRFGVIGIEGLSLVEVLPRPKRAFPGAGEDDRTHGLVEIEAIQRREEFLAHGAMPSIEDVGAVQGDDPHGPALFRQYELRHDALRGR